MFTDGEGEISTNLINFYKKDYSVLEVKQDTDCASITEAKLLGAEKVKAKTSTGATSTRKRKIKS